MKEKTINNRRYRVTKKTTIWIPGVYFYYPEERYKWWPFWFKFIYGNSGRHVCFNNSKDAWDYIDLISKLRLIKTEIQYKHKYETKL